MALASLLQCIPVGALVCGQYGRSRFRRRLLTVARAGELAGCGTGAAVVWYKHDLRVDDHPGLVAAASQYQTVVPLYVFDHRIISGLSDEMLHLLLIALEDLKELLKDQGTDLCIRFGSAEDEVMKVAVGVKANQVFVEEDLDYSIQNVINNVGSRLSSVAFPWGRPRIVLWKTPFFDIMRMKELPTSYDAFQKLNLPILHPIVAPTLSMLNVGIDRGDLPTIGDLKRYLNHGSWTNVKKLSPQTILEKQAKATEKNVLRDSFNNYSSSIHSKIVHNVRIIKSFFASKNVYHIKGGTDDVLDALSAYLKYLEGTRRDDWQELHDKMRLAESRKGSSFGVLFGASLYFGTVSRRRIHYEAIKYEKERNAGFLSPFGYSSPTVAAAVEAVCSAEWYQLLALKSQVNNEGTCSIRIWRWRGFLIQYTAAGDEGPPVIFVHGFGAFLEHFRDNICSMGKTGHRVWGITLLGFGRSEKPNVVYSEPMWAELLRDFVVDVVKEPAHLIGNSIGGYFVAATAGFWPVLVKSVILVNTAGPVAPNYSPVPLWEPRESSGFAGIGSRLLLLYLRLRAADILKKCYPTHPERVDDWLVNEIRRAVSWFQKEASYDPGAAIVLEYVFNYKRPVPLNYLLELFGGKVLFIQGMRDPLTNSKERLSTIREHCNFATIEELDAGHCPHDECPEEVNRLFSEWIRTAERSNIQG